MLSGWNSQTGRFMRANIMCKVSDKWLQGRIEECRVLIRNAKRNTKRNNEVRCYYARCCAAARAELARRAARQIAGV